ncbi:unnamed protein product, partial [Musa banksii]
GTLTALSAFSEGKLVDKIKSAALLTPVAYLTYMTTPIGRAAGSAFSGEVRTTIRSGVITKYDYGSSMANMVAYGQSSPPEYHMPNIPHHLPLLLSYGGGDMLSDVKDVQLLLKDLRNHDADKLVAQLVKEYAHLDFVMGVNAKQVVYDGLIAFFGKHS